MTATGTLVSQYSGLVKEVMKRVERDASRPTVLTTVGRPTVGVDVVTEVLSTMRLRTMRKIMAAPERLVLVKQGEAVQRTIIQHRGRGCTQKRV